MYGLDFFYTFGEGVFGYIGGDGWVGGVVWFGGHFFLIASSAFVIASLMVGAVKYPLGLPRVNDQPLNGCCILTSCVPDGCLLVGCLKCFSIFSMRSSMVK